MSTPPTIDSWQQSHTVCCVSPLVSMLCALWSDSRDTEADQYPMQDRTVDGSEEIVEACSTATRCEKCKGEGEVGLPEIPGDDLDPGTATCPDCGGDCYTGEVMEYWVVDTYLADLLEAQGEGVFDADVIGIIGGKVWCRTTSGQLIAADWAIETAYKLHCEHHYAAHNLAGE